MKLTRYKLQALKRLIFSLMIVLIYILGSNIYIPGIDSQAVSKLLHQTAGLSFAMSMTGFSIDHISLFSLGLGPWMSSMIIWRVVSVSKVFHIENLTQNQSYHIKYVLSIFLGVIQSTSIIFQVQLLGDAYNPINKVNLVLILVSGLSILIWLGNLNAIYGIGGPTIIILVSMLRSWPNRLLEPLMKNSNDVLTLSLYCMGVLLLLLLSFIIFRFYQGEHRLPLMHVMLDNSFSRESYIPIPTNPAGGMPFMYAFSVVLLPQYIFFILKNIYSKNNFLNNIYEQVQLDHLLGVFFLILSLIILTYGFSYVNIDYKELAENMKKSGDYFYNVYPGKNTERYLYHNISVMAGISAAFNSFIIGIPMIASVYWHGISVWVYFIPTWIILMILIREIIVQFSRYYHRNDYFSLLP
ncbi:accessory Sec system protein translocase subunit SecY2 [Lactococcus lactis]|uniref:accessory Sec system protein translocase subunit SecY2 n=1 Tax=Lactococcus lactis TaxID=1358 RepID=UPI002890B72C|nr:accessory Sec system protein translocase subunit SecY2 [Lactococcus lactis]MDT2887979.1 accessory Sec system protein translocase subunit SecY2 [Lactococcus lactis]MDT2930759.1 accessory Sec system protein translocase subunit SecY2 [Lactococcus lactis]